VAGCCEHGYEHLGSFFTSGRNIFLSRRLIHAVSVSSALLESVTLLRSLITTTVEVIEQLSCGLLVSETILLQSACHSSRVKQLHWDIAFQESAVRCWYAGCNKYIKANSNTCDVVRVLRNRLTPTGNACDFFSGSVWIESLPQHWLSSLGFLVVFLSPSLNMPDYYLDHFLAHVSNSLCTNHSIIRRCAVSATESIFK
jgi:hypothetical protein